MNRETTQPSHSSLLAVLGFALVFPSLVTWIYFVALASASPAVQSFAAGAGKLIQFALPIVWVFVIRRAKPKLARPRASDVVIGVASGAAIVAAMFVLYFVALKPAGWFDPAVEPIRAKVAGFGIDTFWKYFALGLFYALVHSLLEEYYWRWFVFGELRRVARFWPAAIVSSLGFMAHHVILLGIYFGFASPLTWLFAISVAVGGLIWAWIYERTGNLYGAWISHLLVDAGIFVVGWDIVRPAIGQ
jgi:membrane protease YdiL (CAAX protease family)